MTRKPHGEYLPGWKEFATQVKEDSGWCCIRCGHPNDRESGHVLTVHHLTNNKSEPYDHWWAFVALCQRCHLSVQSRVDMDRPWVIAEHTPWFKPYVGGFYAWKYLGVNVPRSIVEAHLPFFLLIERDITLGGMTKEAMIERMRFVFRVQEEYEKFYPR